MFGMDYKGDIQKYNLG